MSADLKLVISADVAVATKQVKEFSKEVEEMGKDATAAAVGMEKLNPATSKVQVSLAKTAMAAAKADSALDKIKQTSNVAGQSLQNLGRIAQDAPFGFIGIQNNLNPLIESFGRLKAETGGSGSALKALAGSLGGVGGIGLAISVVTGLLTMFAQGMFDSKESAEELGNELQSLGVDFDDAKRKADSLVKSMDALKGLRDINLKLNIPDDKNRINVQLGFDKQDLETQLRQLRELERVSKEKGENAFNLMLKKGSKELNDLIGTYTSLNEVRKNGNDLADKDLQLLDENLKSQQELTGIQNDQEIIRINIRKLDAQAKSDLVEITKKETERVKNVKTIADVIAKMNRQIALLNQEEFLFDTNETKGKISAIQAAIRTLVTELKVSPKDTLITKLFGDISALTPGIERFEKMIAGIKIKTGVEILIEKDQAEQELNAKLGLVKMKPVKIPLVVELSDSQKRVVAFAEEASSTISNLAVDAFSQLGDSIGKALAGAENPIGSFFGGIASLLAQSLKDLGKYVIKSSAIISTLKKTLNAAFAGNPALGIAAGIALIAIGAALEASLPKFADGVKNFGGGYAVVGERGPEVVRLPRGSDVIPNGQIGGLSGGGQQVFIPDVRLRGSDLVVVFNRASQTISRNG